MNEKGLPPKRRQLKQHWGLFLAGAVSLAAYSGLVQRHLQTGTLTFGSVPATLGWYTLAFLAYLGGLLWIEHRNGLSLKLVFGSALLFRLLLLITLPTLSGDVYRYVWEGHLITKGVSPYAYPVESPQLDHLDIPQRAQVDHASMASPYLPAAQALFVAVAGLFPLHPFYFQLVMTAFDLLSGLLLVLLLRLAHLPDYRSAIYLLNPLVIVEVAHGAHLDAWMVFLTLLALWLTFTPRRPGITPWLGPPILALAVLTKGLPILALAVLVWRWRWQQIVIFGAALAIMIVPAGVQAGWGLSGPLDGAGLFGALRIFVDRWNFNSSIFHWLEVNLLEVYPPLWANRWARQIVVSVMLLVLLGVWLAARRLSAMRSLLRLMALPFMASILLSTTVHPWYALILLAFLPFLAPAEDESPWRWLALTPWVYLSWALALSYWTYLNPPALREFHWVRATEWQPTFVLLALYLLRWLWQQSLISRYARQR
jgi:hypothetical protein